MLEQIKKQCKVYGVPLITGDMECILTTLVAVKKPRKILEIGSGIGYSGFVMCSAFSDAHITTLELDKTRSDVAKENLKGFNATVVNCDCNSWLASNKEKFDFIFLDGPKGKYDLMLPDIVRSLNMGGTLVADNIFFHGMVTGETEVTSGARTLTRHLQKFIEDAKMNEELDVQILEKADGVLIATKRN